MKYSKIIFYILAIIPWGFVISFCAFYFNVTQLIGHFPSPGNPEPSRVSFYNDYSSIIIFTLELWLISLFIWFFLIIINIIINKKKTDWTFLASSGLGHLFGILLLFSEMFEWYAD